MPNFGPDLMGEVEGALCGYNDVPPPGFDDEGYGSSSRSASRDARLKKATAKRLRRAGTSGASIEGFSLRKGLKKAGRGLRSAGKGIVKLHTMPLKAAGKVAAKVAKAVGKQAARPVRALFQKLAMRRARYLAYQARHSTVPTSAEKARAGAWAASKMRRNPLGLVALKILQHTWGTGVGGTFAEENTLGMTGVEIAAAVTAVIGALTSLIKSLNKPGEAPADPRSGGPVDQPAAAPSDSDSPLQTVTNADAEAAGIYDRL